MENMTTIEVANLVTKVGLEDTIFGGLIGVAAIVMPESMVDSTLGAALSLWGASFVILMIDFLLYVWED